MSCGSCRISRVSIDGRLDTCYPAEVINAHWQLYDAEPFDTNTLNLAKADFALLPSNLAGSLALAKSNGWHAVYLDKLAVVLVKDLKQFPKLAGLSLPAQGGANSTLRRAAFRRNITGALKLPAYFSLRKF